MPSITTGKLIKERQAIIQWRLLFCQTLRPYIRFGCDVASFYSLFQFCDFKISLHPLTYKADGKNTYVFLFDFVRENVDSRREEAWCSEWKKCFDELVFIYFSYPVSKLDGIALGFYYFYQNETFCFVYDITYYVVSHYAKTCIS